MNSIFIPGLGTFVPRFTHKALSALYRETGTTPASFEPGSMENMDAMLYHSISADAKEQGAELSRARFQNCIDEMSGVEYMRLVRKAAAVYREAFTNDEAVDEEKNV